MNGSGILWAFGFANLAMLGWLAAAAAPLLIHLWNRRRYREVPWAAMRYLLAAMRKNSRRIQVEQWILLALRTAIIALAVLAVAEPYLERAGMGFVAGQHTHKVLVLDGSFSMGFRPGDQDLFERAKELAGRLVEESPQGDGFTLVLLGAPPRVVVAEPAYEHGDVLEEIENLKLPHGSADLPATLERVETLVERSRREHPRLQRSEVFFFTDLGRASWLPEAADEQSLERFRQRARRLGRTSRLVVVDLAQPGAENTAVTDLRCTEPLVTRGREVLLEAQVRNLGRQEHRGELVEWLVDGRRAGESSVDLPAGGEAWASFRYRFEQGGNHAVEARLKSDLLDIDNHRWLAVPVKESLRVLCVNGKPGGEPFSGAADYLAVALSPETDAARPRLIEPDVVGESALVEADLTRYDCVFLANVGQFTAAEARVLEAHLRSGGGLVTFLGDQVHPESYNRYLCGEDTRYARLLPAQIGQRVGASLFHLDALDYQHPLVQPFRNQERSGLLTSPVYQYFKLQMPPDARGKVALRFLETTDAAVIEEPLFRGRSVLVATSADVSWTALPAGPAFVPIVQEMLALAVGQQRAELNVLVGQAVGSSSRVPTSDVPVTLEPPAGETVPLRLETSAEMVHWNWNDTWTSGVYAARWGPPVARHDLFAVNVDPRESDLTPLDATELRQELWPGVPLEHRADWQDFDEQPTGNLAGRSGLHQTLLYCVLGLMFLEGWCAWRFGHQRG